ncbi:MAG: hypothetical protein ACRCZ9_00010 [Fusobacteriaceae bacterium]
MPLPFFIAGIAAVFGAAATGAAAVGTAVVTGAAVAAATVGATAAAIAGTTLLTVGGIVITAGTVAGVAAGAAIAFGISEVLMEESNHYSSQNITEQEKKRERNRLKKMYEEQLESLKKLEKIEGNSELKKGIISAIEGAQKYCEVDEYYNAINFIKNFKLVYAENKKNEKIAKEAEDVLKCLIEVRRETISLRGKNNG